MPDETDQVNFDNPLDIRPVDMFEDDADVLSAKREHACRPRFPRTWAEWQRDLIKGHMWLSVWFMEEEVGIPGHCRGHSVVVALCRSDLSDRWRAM
jgi:hypothetical protein